MGAGWPNLVVNSLNRGAPDPVADACAWVDTIDPGIVGEVHLAGYNDEGPLVIDDHGSTVHPKVWQVYRHAMQRLGPLDGGVAPRLPLHGLARHEPGIARRLGRHVL